MHYDVEESVEDMAYPERIDKDIFAMKKEVRLSGDTLMSMQSAIQINAPDVFTV